VTAAVGAGRLAGYAALGLPLAMAALPVYVHVPKLYGDELGVPLATVGALLLVVRLLDAIQDPLLGFWSDRTAARGGARTVFVVAALPLVAGGLWMLFHPPQASTATLAAWLGAGLVATYLGFSMASISYFAIGAELSTDYHERTRVTAARGAAGVIGVLLAAALPQWLAADGDLAAGLRRFSLVHVPVLVVGAGALLLATSRSADAAHAPGAMAPRWRDLAAPLGNRRFRWLLAVFVGSGVASAIPATLILFFVQDVLGRGDLAPAFLGIYFLFGAAGMPLWVATSKRIGKKRAWALGMGMSVVAFVGAAVLGDGDAIAFGVICALSGIAYGAELALPPSILADVVDADRATGAASRPDGAYFGFWQLSEKLNLALAAGIALPLLGAVGYVPGTPQGPGGSLSLMYAALPCALKLAGIALLSVAPIESRSAPAAVAH
jgi:Na+/melibiose symporter-like transporter